MFTRKPIITLFAGVALSAAAATSVYASALVSPAAVPMVTAPVDDNIALKLDYDAPMSMHIVSDKGALGSSTRLEHVQLVLNRPAARNAALDQLVKDQLDPKSPDFRRWVSPSDFGKLFGPADADIGKVTDWLSSHGLTVVKVAANKMSIEFAGTAEQIAKAFKTEVHNVVTADGESHMSNASAPSIPAALSGIVHGVTLSNFFPRPMMRRAPAAPATFQPSKASVASGNPSFTFPSPYGTFYAVTPTDFATIYDETQLLNGSSLFGAPITGQGVTVIVAEETNIKRADWNKFRTNFDLTGYAGTLTFVHPGGCADPGFTGDEDEAALDAEWSSAAAPGASIIEASCASTPTTFGVMTTLDGLVNEGPAGSAISVSYGGCEVANGLSFLAQWSALVQQAAAEGISVFISTGDELGAGCDNPGSPAATHGLNVNGLASNIYDTAVGGTDFGDTSLHENAQYWSASNSPTKGSALSYIPEIPWNNSCASSVLYQFFGAPDAISFCNSSAGSKDSQDIVGASGGKSLYYAKPEWQSTSVLGVAADKSRDLPDISLFAANGIWAHFYIYCMSDASEGGSPCNLNNVNDLLGNAAGGTSFSAPIMAGITALLAQVEGQKVGNLAPELYSLAQLQFSNELLYNTCLSNKGASSSKACVFHEVTRGDIAAPCVSGTANCFSNSESTEGLGVLSSSTTTEEIAYPAHAGWSFAVGLGTLDIANLLYSYPNPPPSP
jgi:subtilase family serine protease